MPVLKEHKRDAIGGTLRGLREDRRWSQAELAARLEISQSNLSQIERGLASLTAEQFLETLRLFNVTTRAFTGGARDREDTALQSSLARYGARHLRVDPDVVPDEADDLHATILAALSSGDPRLIAALAPVLVENAGDVNFAKLAVDTERSGRRARFHWVIENTLEATRDALATARLSVAPRYRKAIRELAFALEFASGFRVESDDLLEPGLRNMASVNRARTASSALSQKWRVVSRLRVEDFASALRQSHAD